MTLKEKTTHDIMNKHSDLWKIPWRLYCLRELAKIARTYILSFDPFVMKLGFSFLDNRSLCKRIVVGKVNEASHIIAQKLAETGRLRDLVDDELKQYSTQLKKNEAEDIIFNFLKTCLISNEARHIVKHFRPKDIYKTLSDILSEEIVNRKNNGDNISDIELLSILLIINYFRVWEMSAINLYKFFRIEIFNGAIGIRGVLLGIQQKCPDFKANTIPQKVKPKAISLPSQIIAKSCLLLSICNESEKILSKQGFLHRIININSPIDPSIDSSILEAKSLNIAEIRHEDYLQYEYYALLFTSLSGIEFLLRSYSPIEYSKNPNLLYIINKLKNCGILSNDLACDLETVFDKEKLNLRNRVFHGAFFDVEARRFEQIMALGIVRNWSVENTEYLPESIAAFISQLLEKLFSQLYGRDLNTTWTNDFLLTTEDINFAKTLCCDILESERSVSAWFLKISRFLKDTCPGISSPLKMGITGWLSKNDGINNLPTITFLCLLIEPVIRLTLHRLGMKIIQESTRNEGGEKVYCFQYFMLDTRGLLCDTNIDILTNHLSSEEQKIAKQSLKLICKIRDAFAHGAITEFSEELRLSQGHLFVKTIQLLSSVTIPP